MALEVVEAEDAEMDPPNEETERERGSLLLVLVSWSLLGAVVMVWAGRWMGFRGGGRRGALHYSDQSVTYTSTPTDIRAYIPAAAAGSVGAGTGEGRCWSRSGSRA